MKRVKCYCLFDITPTGITTQRRNNSWPVYGKNGQVFENERALHYARNQQRNWDTITQIISLRTQPFNLKDPMRETVDDPAALGFDIAGPLEIWSFEFETEFDSQWKRDNDDLYELKHDTKGVPMIIELEESSGIGTLLEPEGPVCNIIYCSI